MIIVFYFLTRRDFFWDMIFIFLINLVDYSFFYGYLSLFCFNWTSFFNKCCEAKEFGNPGPFHIKPKAHVEEEEMSEDERRRSKLPKDIAEDNPVLSQPKS